MDIEQDDSWYLSQKGRSKTVILNKPYVGQHEKSKRSD